MKSTFATCKLKLILLGVTINIAAQDIHFSQFESTPLQINPASTGSNGSYELIFGYRSQWKQLDQKYSTPVVTGILPFVSKENKIKGGIGVSAISSKSGSALNYQQSGGLLSAAYGVNFTKFNLLAGISSGFYQRSLSGLYSTGAQYQSGSGLNSNLATGEEANPNNKSYFDVSAGLYLSDLKNTSYLGFAAHHLTQPNIGLASTDKLPMRFTLHGGYRFFKTSSTPLTPEIVFNYQNNMQRTLIGARFDYIIKSESSATKNLAFGIIARYAVQDAFVFGLQATKKYFTFAVSQDFTLSKVSAYNKSLGASEVRLSMRIPSKRTAKPIATENYNVGQAREFIVRKEEERDNTKSYTLHIQEVIKFDFADTILTTEGKRIAGDVAQLLKGNKYLKVRVIGHSDNQGTPKRNQEISEQRARVVSDYLVSQGIDRKRVKIDGRGDKEPLKENTTEEGRAENRRVEFEIYK